MTTFADHAPRLLALFDAWVELGPDERGVRLSALAREDPLVAAQLARMLAADGEAGVLDGEMAEVADTLGARLGMPAALAPDGTPGRRVGPFVLARLLGRGGMGEVWLAERGDGDFRQQVALKLLKRGMDTDDLRRRFVQERRILAALSHPGIARFTDGGVGEDGAPWYAMEYVDGVPLTVHAARLRLAVRARVALMLQVVDAVAYAQTRLVVHRDLKPSNILVDADDRVRLLDFGIAKLLHATADARETATGLRAMSPAYAAPEQILDEPISTATDVYSLGVVLFELLTGSLPHQRAAGTIESLADRIRSESTQRPSVVLRRSEAGGATTIAAADAARQAREVAGDLDTIVLTALRHEPERRYPAAAAMADDLRRWLDGRPIAARADSTGYRLRKFVGRHRLAVASAAVVLVALFGGAAVALWQAGLAREQAALAAAEAVRASEQARRATIIKRFFSRMFQDSGPTAQRRGAQFTAREWVEQASARVALDLAEAPEAQAEIRVALAAALLGFDARAEARALLDAAVPQLRASADDDPGALVAGLQYLAIAQRGAGELEAAQATVDEALVVNRRVADREARLETALELRTQHLTQANAERHYAAALEIGRAILRDRAELLGPDHPRLAVDWNNLGHTHNMLEQPVEAGAALDRALALLQADPRTPESRQAYVLAGLCQADLGQGRLAAALAHAARAREVASRTLGANHLMVHRADGCAMATLRQAQRPQEALAVAQRMLASGVGVDDEARGLALLTSGASRIALGEPQAAAPDLARARAVFDAGHGRNVFGSPHAAIAHGLALAMLGDCEAALAAGAHGLTLLEAPEVPVGFRVAEMRLMAADTMTLCGDDPQAGVLRAAARALWSKAWRGGDTAVPERAVPVRWDAAAGRPMADR